jgi:hypothetical protein
MFPEPLVSFMRDGTNRAGNKGQDAQHMKAHEGILSRGGIQRVVIQNFDTPLVTENLEVECQPQRSETRPH